MKPDTPIDYAVFQLSPRHSRCELFVSSHGNTEKLASGLVKPFVAHLKVAEEQVAQAARSIKLEVESHGNSETWFTKGTLERFVRFVSTPEILEMVNTFDAEMSQLEGARRIYSQESDGQHSSASGGDGTGTKAGADATKKELLRAIDVRLAAVRQDLAASWTRASAAGFSLETVSELQHFSDYFGAYRLNEACTKFISLCERRSDLIIPQKPCVEDQVVRSSWGSDMSIDETSEEPSGSHNVRFQNSLQHKQLQQAGPVQQQIDFTRTQDHLNQSKPSSFHPDSSLPAEQVPVHKENKEEEKKTEVSVAEPLPIQPTQPARRLSVQDRINMFENKQKENSGGKPTAVVKPAELRRLSSDVSAAPAAEKAVLRRWSGASDMSIDLGNDKKDNNGTDSPSCTPSSSSAFHKNMYPSASSDDSDQRELNDTTSSVNVEAGRVSGVKAEGSFEKVRGFSDRGASVTVKNQTGFQGHIGNSAHTVEDAELGNRIQDVKIRNQPPSQSWFKGSQTHTRSLSGQFESGFGLRVKEESSKETEDDRSTSQSQWKAFTKELAQERKDLVFLEKELTKVEEFEAPRMKVQKSLSSAPEQIAKLSGRRDESGSANGNNKVFSSNKVSENQDSFNNLTTPSTEQVQRVRQSKGSQELNDELQMKANELEKLFAEHKQSGSTRRGKNTESQVEQTISLQYRKPAATEVTPSQLLNKKFEVEPLTRAGDNAKFSTPSPMKMVDHQDISSLKQNFSSLSFSDDSKGKFYEKYMQKRDAKLREEWGTKRAEKEAQLKAMQDSLNQSSAEMKAKFSGFADKSMSSARRRAEKLKTYQSRSNIKREQHPIDSLQSEEDEDPSDFLEQKFYRQDRSFGEAALMDGASKSAPNKKLFQNRNLASANPRTAAAPIPRSAAKISNSSSGRRRVQSENPLAQSVPNFSDFRKENTKPSSGVSKMANRMQVKAYTRSKSTTEETLNAKEEKPRRSHSLRKSSASPAEYKDLAVNSDDVLEPFKLEKEKNEQRVYENFSKNLESKHFVRKGNGIGPGAGTSTKLKASMTSDARRNEEEFEESPFEADDLVNVAKEEEEDDDDEEMEEDLETTEVDGYANNVNGNRRLSQESDKMSESENDDSLRSLSHIDPSSVAELPTSVPPTFHTIGSLQDSPGESPVSWNSRIHNPFSYPQETSDIDASVDSPIGSPASWNSHSLAQTEADAARMRKKWGSAQKPILAANSTHNLARKDVTKGFKRLLKFGRKSRGAETLADWISATTSEGDDDTEDGRDPANRSSEDLRKSRMGFSQNHASDDGFNESELFNEPVQTLHSSIPAPPANFKLRDDHMSGSSIKAPRSFFSLSTFRSKGSESKLR